MKFRILDDPEFGTYQIVAERQSGGSISKSIKVDQYILPKFSVMMKAPSIITILDDTISIEVSSRYTYDQPVPGTISGRLCRPPSNYYRGNACIKNPDGICVPFTGETDSEGKFKETIDLSSFQMDRSGYLMSLILQVTMTEKGTNVQMTESQTMSITSQLGRAYFDNKVMRPHFKVEIPYLVGITVENGLGQPESGQLVGLQVDGKLVQNMTSDENGRAECEIDTSEFTTSGVNLQLIYKNQEQCYDGNWIVPSYSNDGRYIRRFFSRTNSFVQLQGPKEELQFGTKCNIQVKYSFGKEALAEGETTVKFAYMVLSRARIVNSGEHSVDVSASLKGEFNLTYETSHDHAPVVQFVIHNMLKDEVIGDAINLEVEKGFKNPVTANFSSEMGVPGSYVSLDVTATPASTCLTRVYDTSLMILDQGQTFSPETVYNTLQFNKLSGYNINGLNVEPPRPSCIDVNKQLLHDGIYWQPVNFLEEGDLGKVFREIGLHLITDTAFQQPELCSQPFSFQPIMFARPDAVDAPFMEADIHRTATPTISAGVGGALVIDSMRKHFPELWFYGRTYVGESGSASAVLEVPDTITKWKSDVLCLSNNTGFGMTKYPANFTAFQKMFVDLSLPSSIIRGETMSLVAYVANYIDKCAKVQVSLQSSTDYVAEPVDTDSVKCVCSQERVFYSWKINATAIGVSDVTVTAETLNIGESCEGPADPSEPNRKDTIARNFAVEPEGIKKEVTKTDFVCVKGENSVIQVSVNPSGNIVPGSMSAKVQVIGEMLGRAVSNPEALIVQPMGCGEQNLAGLMPIVHALEFLNLTGRLTEEIKQRAVQNMAIGYGRQLRYKHNDGSFSAFGPGSSKSSAWLTLLTLKTLWAVKSYTFVDDNIFKQGVIYLEKLQDLNTGRFKPVGTLFNSGLKGGSDDDVGFTCAVVVFLLETAYANTPSLLRSSLSYLDAASRKEQSPYNYAMLLYAFRVSGNVERANAMRENLKSLAIDEGGSIHWQRAVRPKQQTPYLFAPPAPSAEMELTATVLKATAYGQTSSAVSAEDLNYMAKISTYLIQQQNIHGSYSTTSDTVAVLDAIVAYGALVYQKDATNTVQLKSGDQVIREFNVDQQSRILLQSEALPQVPGDYSMVVSGNGCVLVQTGVEFYVPIKQEDSSFSLSLTTFPENCTNGVAYSVDIQVNASYHGIQNMSNMAVVRIPFLSGYSIASDSLLKLQSDFPKAEVKNNNLFVYFDHISSEGVSFIVQQEMGSRVDNFQQRTASVVDYYETDENGAAPLFHPCTLSN